MAKAQSTKRLAISKANAQIVGIVAAASFVTIFCLFGAKAAYSQNRYQAKVTAAKEKAHSQLVSNIKAFDSLQSAYKGFDGASNNVISGLKDGNGDNDGPNSKIILDSLPSTYDFPALTSSIEKILHDQGLKVTSISGTDDQLNQQTNLSSPSPQSVAMPFSFTVSDANYTSVGQLITALEHSIRPIQIDSLTLSGGASNMTLTVNAHTYYQPAKDVNITKRVIK
jgi:hypothetical protein